MSFVFCLTPVFGGNEKIAETLQDVSVTIISSDGQGSGTIHSRQRDGETISFVWTAAHVVEGLRHTRKIIDAKTGTDKTVVEFRDAKILKKLVSEGRDVGRTEMYASIIKYNAEEDFALLRVRKKNFLVASATFYLDEKIPPIGTPLIHIGSLLGELGAGSMTEGIVSQHGRLIDEKVFDQTTVTGYPGSSGGGVFLKDGKYVGMLLRAAGPGFNLIAPIRRIRSWAKEVGVAFALDDNIPFPTEDQFKKITIEDEGSVFTTTSTRQAPHNSIFKPLYKLDADQVD